AERVLAALSVGDVEVDVEARTLLAPVSGGARVLTTALRYLDDPGVEINDVGLRRSTLDDVFLTLTGHVAEPEPDGAAVNAPPGPYATAPVRPVPTSAALTEEVPS